MVNLLNSPYPDLPPPPEVNVETIFFSRPDQEEWPNYTMYIDATTGRRRRFRDHIKRIEDARTALGTPVANGGLGLEAGGQEMIGIISINTMEYPVIVHALLGLTVPFTLISAFSTKFEFEHGLRLSKATRLFVHPSLISAVLPVAKLVGISPKHIYILDGHVKGYKGLSDMIHRVQKDKLPAVELREATRDTLAYLVFSSGTSGLPKAVMITHGNLLYSIFQTVTVMTITAEVYEPPPPPTPEGILVALAFLPMHHTYGLHAYCFRACLQQATCIMIPKWDVETALKCIAKYRITSLTLIPSVVHQLVNYRGIEKADLSSVQFMASGAAYLPPALAEKLTNLVTLRGGVDVRFSEGYGMSEGTIATLGRPFPGTLGGKLKDVPGCSGVLLPGITARLVGDDGKDVGVDEIGELYIRGGNISPGYWNNEKANKETFVDGWLRTGDKFKVDKEGYFFFADRAKDTLKVSGSQVSPVEIENVLLAHPDKLITDVSVAGVSGGRTSDEKVPRAWVVLSSEGRKRGSAVVIKELEKWHQEQLSKYKWLRGGIEVVRSIPKSPTGKTLRRVLVDQYEARQAKKVKSKL